MKLPHEDLFVRVDIAADLTFKLGVPALLALILWRVW